MAWFAFDVDEYDADTMHLSAAEDGVYSRLLRFYYKTRVALPDNDAALAAIGRVPMSEWEGMKTTIRAFFKSRRGKLHQKRCDKELDREDALAKKRSEKSKNAAEKRHGKSKTYLLRATPEQPPGITMALLGDATRPDQTIQKETDATASSTKGAADGSKPTEPRGTRLPVDWEPDADDRDYARNLGLDPERTAEEFRLYWQSVPGAKGRKLDWSKTFRGRCQQLGNPRGVNGSGQRAGRTRVASVVEAGRDVVDAIRAQQRMGRDGVPSDGCDPFADIAGAA